MATAEGANTATSITAPVRGRGATPLAQLQKTTYYATLSHSSLSRSRPRQSLRPQASVWRTLLSENGAKWAGTTNTLTSVGKDNMVLTEYD